MDKFNLQDNLYDEGWQNTADTVVKPEDTESEIIYKTENIRGKHHVFTLQLVLVICALLCLFAVKFFSTAVYDTVISRYNELLSTSLIYSGDSGDFDFLLSGATSDEV